MFGPVEGLKVVVEVDTTTAQAKLREFSGTMSTTAATAAAGWESAESKMKDLLGIFDESKRASSEHEAAMRNLADSAQHAGAKMGALGVAASSLVPIMAGLIGLGIAKVLWDAAKATDEFQSAMASIKQAVTESQEGLGAWIVKTGKLDHEMRALAGAIQLVNDALKTGDSEFDRKVDAMIEKPGPLIAYLEQFAPKPVVYGEAGGLFSAEARSTEAMFRSLEKSVSESRKLSAEQKKIADEAERAKKEFEDSVAHVYRMVEATEKEYWRLQGLFQLIDEKNAKFTSKEEGGGGWLGLGSGDAAWNDTSGGSGGWGADSMLREERIAAITTMYLSLGDAVNVVLPGLSEMNRLLAVQMGIIPPLAEGTKELTVGQQAMQEALVQNAQAFAGLAAAQIMAALAGETSWKKALNTIAKQMFTMNLAYALQNLAFGIMASTGVGSGILGGTAAQFYAAAAKFAIVAAAWGAIAAVSGGFSSGGGGGGGGGKGRPGGRDIAPAVPGNVGGDRETVVNVVITGQGYIQNLEAFARELSEQMTRELRSAGR